MPYFSYSLHVIKLSAKIKTRWWEHHRYSNWSLETDSSIYRNIECVSYSAKSALLCLFLCLTNGKKKTILVFRVSIVIGLKQVFRFFFGWWRRLLSRTKVSLTHHFSLWILIQSVIKAERENSISQSSPVVGKDTARYTAYTVKRKSEFFLFTEWERKKERPKIHSLFTLWDKLEEF
jgi:hypothetical protein